MRLVRITGKGLVPVVKHTLIAIWTITPRMLRAGSFCLRLMALAFVTIWIDADEAARRIANRRMMEARNRNVVTIVDSAIWWSVYIAVWLSIIAGWVLISFAITFLVLVIT